MIRMDNTILFVGRGGISIVIGDNQQSALRIMQLMDAEDDGDITLYEKDFNFTEDEE